MNDRELLELAAKAAGFVNWSWRGASMFVETGHSRGNTGYYWDSLTDDGDCARMEAELELSPEWYNGYVVVMGKVVYYADHKGDKQAARRRASTMAAAEIGRNMK